MQCKIQSLTVQLRSQDHSTNVVFSLLEVDSAVRVLILWISYYDQEKKIFPWYNFS